MTAATDLHGVVDGLDDQTYLTHPALSASGVRRLLPPSTPAHYRYWADHPQPPKQAFDLGHAVHKMVLGVGQEIEVVKADNYQTKAAREARDAAYASGRIPLLPHEHEQAKAMAAAVRSNPLAAALFNPDRGQPEQSLFWSDEETDAPLRARLDWLPTVHGGRMVIPDLKTCVSASPAHLRKATFDYGYFIQAPFYMAGVQALGLAEDVGFVFVFVEKDPPHLTVVRQLKADAILAGQDAIRRATDLYADCLITNTWPGNDSDIEEISLPPWAARQLEETHLD
jgi:hypothetical protein